MRQPLAPFQCGARGNVSDVCLSSALSETQSLRRRQRLVPEQIVDDECVEAGRGAIGSDRVAEVVQARIQCLGFGAKAGSNFFERRH